jgi:predicted DNA-binding protein with PD1-like motif
MKVKLLNEAGLKSWVVVLDTGNEAASCLLAFAEEHGVTAASLSAVGGFASAVLGFFDVQTKQYRHIPIGEQMEVLALTGDITQAGEQADGKAKVHAHTVVGLADGHLLEGYVRPTLEVIVAELPAHLRRRHDPATGLALIAL